MSIILVCIVAFFFAMNIGASGAAASMGIAYGSGAVKSRYMALLICGIGVMLGASFGGGEVAKTLGSEIIPEEIISVNIALIILSASTVSLFIANLCGIPLSTSEVTVGSIVGVGIAFKVLFVNSLVVIIMYWLIVPVIACLLAFLADKAIKRIEKRTSLSDEHKWTKWLTILVIATGFMEAFSAGMNNVANAVSPLVASGVLNSTHTLTL